MTISSHGTTNQVPYYKEQFWIRTKLTLCSKLGKKIRCTVCSQTKKLAENPAAWSCPCISQACTCTTKTCMQFTRQCMLNYTIFRLKMNYCFASRWYLKEKMNMYCFEHLKKQHIWHFFLSSMVCSQIKKFAARQKKSRCTMQLCSR